VPICIYCRSETNPFEKSEHVLPKAFGRFKHNLTLLGSVCDECNAYFSKELELYLARDTPDGLNRFRFGAAKPQDYKSLGARSSMQPKAGKGQFEGAPLTFEPHDGELLGMVAENVGFRAIGEPTFRWYKIDEVPPVTELKALIGAGGPVEIQITAADSEGVRRKLLSLGYPVGEFVETRPAGWRGGGMIDIDATLGLQYARAIGKICFNYLAKKYGSETALMPQFDDIRSVIRYGDPLKKLRWQPLPRSFIGDGTALRGHAIAINWSSEHVFARISFAPEDRHSVIELSREGFSHPVPENTGSFFNLDSMEIQDLEPGKRLLLVVAHPIPGR